VGDTRQNLCKEIDVIWTQFPMMVKETANWASGFPAVKHTITKLQRTARKDSGGFVATATIVLEFRLIARLCKQHVIDRVDFAIWDVMVVHEPAEIVNMVPALQLATGNAQGSTGKLSGMAMAFKTTVIPHPMKINTSSLNRLCQ
jgi:hypothetical protein